MSETFFLKELARAGNLMAEEAAGAVDKPATTGSDPPTSSGRALVRYNSSVQNLAEGLWNR